MKTKIFVDGQEGTTGLKIHEYLSLRSDVEVLKIDPEKRKDPAARAELINEADIVFLCLPDAAARESVSLVKNPKTRIIDTSTAFRTSDRWTYGLPELGEGQREKIRISERVANPGCHATGFILAVNPLVKKGILPVDYPVSCCSITGYSGGGRKLIERYETNAWKTDKRYPRHYSLGLNHKHLPEMQMFSGLKYPPLFTPVVADFYNGMIVSVPIVTRLLPKSITAENVREVLADYYEEEPFVKVMPFGDVSSFEDGYFTPEACNGTNRLEIFVFGNDERILVAARFDNLGKGASGAAIQNLNIMLGVDETTGLKA